MIKIQSNKMRVIVIFNCNVIIVSKVPLKNSRVLHKVFKRNFYYFVLLEECSNGCCTAEGLRDGAVDRGSRDADHPFHLTRNVQIPSRKFKGYGVKVEQATLKSFL